ncbi:hypothetical protein QBC34DRAFT_376333 [Podospora aff. communis PSN243]|uniref:HNH nuclease domain-containing protein n=1 Tax=Podospora aff. communis PSN243 TaxID=3040156 RepID=A0AAV9H1A4_9PEZI|nr:hypothetical protein QBC34DRAFT_376333 [Podospora aff. communis PSN243]
MSSRRRNELDRFLYSLPEWRPTVPVLLDSAVDSRIDLIGELQKERHQRFSEIQLACLFLMDREELRGSLGAPNPRTILHRALDKIDRLVQMLIERQRRSLVIPFTEEENHRLDLDEQGGRDRQNWQCMVTRKPNAVMSRITTTMSTSGWEVNSVVDDSIYAASVFFFPLTASSTPPEMPRDMASLRSLLCGHEPVYWNTVMLHPQIELWRRSWYFAFECLGITDSDPSVSSLSRLKLQVRWMPKRSLPMRPLLDLKKHHQPVFQGSYGQGIGYNWEGSGGQDDSIDNNSLIASRRNNGHSVEDGDIVYIVVDRCDA